MRTVIITLLLISMPTFAENLQCDDIPATWEKLKEAVQHSRPDPAYTARFRSLISSCHSEGHLTGIKKIKYSLGNFDTLVSKGYRVELYREIDARKAGLSGNNQRLNQMASQAGVPAKHISMVEQLPDGQKQCKSFDYRDKLPPMRDQGSTGWCYGHVAADLASYKLGKNVSPLDAAILGHENDVNFYRTNLLLALVGKNKEDFKVADMDKGGGAKHVLEQMKYVGACLNEDLPGNDIQHELAAQNIRERWNQTQALTTVSMRGRCRGDCELVSNSTMQTLAPNLSDTDINEIRKTSSPESFTLEVRNKACKKRVPFPSKAKSVKQKNVKQLMEAARDQLEKGNIFGIAYDSKVLTSRKWEQKGDGHASVIVGQRWNSSAKRCELLLRNSWGSACEAYRADFECDSNGYVWLPAYDIISASKSITYVE